MQLRVIKCMIMFTLMLSVLPGCWSNVEVNNNAFVTSVFIDLGPNNDIELTLGFPLTSRMVSGVVGSRVEGNIYTTVTKTDKNLATAYRKVQTDLTRDITWGHTRVVVISTKFAEHGIMDALDFFARQPTFSQKCLFFITKSKASELANMVPAFEQFPSVVIREFANQGVTLGESLQDILTINSYGGDLILPMLTTGKKPMRSEKGALNTWVSSGGAAFLNKGKLVGVINQKDLQGALWLKEVTNETVVTIQAQETEEPVSALVTHTKTKKRPKLENGEIIFRVEIEAELNLISVDAMLDIDNPAIVASLEKQFANRIAHRMEKVFHKSQKIGSDAFQVSQYMDWYYPREWGRVKDDWSSRYKSVVFRCPVSVSLKRVGAIQNPVIKKEYGG